MLAPTKTDTPIYLAHSIVSADRGGSSRPVVIETDAGYFFTKLRGAAQGTAALVAEIIAAGLAEALGLWVPSRVLIAMEPTITGDVHEDELMDLLSASYGLNLGFQYLYGARNICGDEIAAIDEEFACKVLWLDALVMNVDRTAHNSNLMRSQDKLWVIDHGAALPFQYNWSAIVEQSPRRATYAMHRHIFGNRVRALDRWDHKLAAMLSRAVLQTVVSQVPDCFLAPLMPPGASTKSIDRRRQAYVAYLWKRLKFPRPFMVGP